MPSVRTRCLCTTFAMATAFQCATTPATAQTFAPPSASIPQTSRAFTGLFQDTVTDFRNLASQDTLTMLAVGGLDGRRAARRGPSRPPRCLSGSNTGFLSSGETIGSARLQFGSALATLAVGHVYGQSEAHRRRRRSRPREHRRADTDDRNEDRGASRRVPMAPSFRFRPDIRRSHLLPRRFCSGTSAGRPVSRRTPWLPLWPRHASMRNATS